VRAATVGRAYVLADVSAERDRQDEKWGGQPGTERTTEDAVYAGVLGEEFGEVCKAMLECDANGLREELVQVAAVAVAWVEQIDLIGPTRR
jgi:NTP pyrophosphatase (non-canonical NTP hydrolase)